MKEKIMKINMGLDKRFPKGKDPFKIITRLVEECGELAAEVNHFENEGIKRDKRGESDKKKLAKEIQDVLRCIFQLVTFYDVEEELDESIQVYYERVKKEGLIDE
jgi:NTP pyrophosphatase (non-canonical NTP hydrolase)